MTARPADRPGERAPSEGGARDERVWRALADPTRRAILDLLRAGPLPAGQVSERFTISRFGVRKHLQVLVQAGLVVVEERGRERWHHLNAAPLRALYRRWIRPFDEPAADFLLDVQRRAEARAARREPGPDRTP